MEENIIDIVISIPCEKWEKCVDLISENEGYKTQFNNVDIFLKSRYNAWNPYIRIHGIEFYNNNKLDDFEKKLKVYFAVEQDTIKQEVIESIYQKLLNANV